MSLVSREAKTPLLTPYSDGSTPVKQVQQILAVTPILPGQNYTEKNPIPKRNPSIVSTTSPPKAASPAASQAPPQAQENDLIDFGQNEPPTQAPVPLPVDLKAAQTENGGQQQKDLERMLRSTSNERGQGSLIDFHDDMKAALPDAHKLQRLDTDTQSLDEFHDAEG